MKKTTKETRKERGTKYFKKNKKDIIDYQDKEYFFKEIKNYLDR